MIIGFIGLGNMARAIIGGILQDGMVQPGDILGSDHTAEAVQAAGQQFGIGTTRENTEVAQKADVVILAVKPGVMADVIAELRDHTDADPLYISIAAGKTIGWLEEQFGAWKGHRIVRFMPNTPALVQAGCTAVCRNAHATDDDLETAMKIARSFGTAEVVQEGLFDTISAVSSCSPAYVFMFIEAMADAGVKGGMKREQAYRFAAQAVLGSAKLVLETGKHPGELKDMVCSPGGTTIEGLQMLEEHGFRAAVMDAIGAAIAKAKKL